MEGHECLSCMLDVVELHQCLHITINKDEKERGKGVNDYLTLVGDVKDLDAGNGDPERREDVGHLLRRSSAGEVGDVEERAWPAHVFHSSKIKQ